MGQNGNPLDLSLQEYVAGISQELTDRLAHLQAVVGQVAAQPDVGNLPIAFCPLVDCRARQRYRVAVQQAVKVLEETRRSFKSRQLEALRRMLEEMLVEDRPSGTGKI
jgi:hypothetical protein